MFQVEIDPMDVNYSSLYYLNDNLFTDNLVYDEYQRNRWYNSYNNDLLADITSEAESIAQKYYTVGVDSYFKNIISYSSFQDDRKINICNNFRSLKEYIKYLYSQNLYILQYTRRIIPTLRYLHYVQQQLQFNKTLFQMYMRINIKYLIRSANLQLNEEKEYRQYKFLLYDQLCNHHNINTFVQQLQLKKAYQFVVRYIKCNLDILKFKQYLQKFISVLYDSQSTDLEVLFRSFYNQCLQIDREMIQLQCGIQIDISSTKIAYSHLRSVFNAFLRFYALQLLKRIFVQQRAFEIYFTQKAATEIHKKQIFLSYFRSKRAQECDYLNDLEKSLEGLQQKHIQQLSNLAKSQRKLEINDQMRYEIKNENDFRLRSQDDEIGKQKNVVEAKMAEIAVLRQKNKDLQAQIAYQTSQKEFTEKQKQDLRTELARLTQETSAAEQGVQRQKKQLNILNNQIQTMTERQASQKEQQIAQITKSFEEVCEKHLQQFQQELIHQHRQLQQMNLQELREALVSGISGLDTASDGELKRLDAISGELSSVSGGVLDISGLFERQEAKKQLQTIYDEIRHSLLASGGDAALGTQISQLKQQIQIQTTQIYQTQLSRVFELKNFFGAAEPALQGRLNSMLEALNSEENEINELQQKIEQAKAQNETLRRQKLVQKQNLERKKERSEQKKSLFQLQNQTSYGSQNMPVDVQIPQAPEKDADKKLKKSSSKAQIVEISSSTQKESKWKFKNSIDEAEDTENRQEVTSLMLSQLQGGVFNSQVAPVPPQRPISSQQAARARSQGLTPIQGSSKMTTAQVNGTETSELLSYMFRSIGMDERSPEAVKKYLGSILGVKYANEVALSAPLEKEKNYMEDFQFYDIAELFEEDTGVESY